MNNDYGEIGGDDDEDILNRIPPEFRQEFLKRQRAIQQNIEAYKREVNGIADAMIQHNKEVVSFFKGILYGAILGIFGNFLVSFFIEAIRIPLAANWHIYSIIFVIAFTLLIGVFILDSYDRIKSSNKEIDLAVMRKLDLLAREQRRGYDL